MKSNHHVSKRSGKNTCVICRRNTYVPDGCHLEYDLDFCSVLHLTMYTEILYHDILTMIETHAKRIDQLEKAMK